VYGFMVYVYDGASATVAVALVLTVCEMALPAHRLEDERHLMSTRVGW